MAGTPLISFQHCLVWEKHPEASSEIHQFGLQAGEGEAELRDSPDMSVQKNKAQVRTGRKWNVMQAVDQAINCLKHQQIVGFLQPGWAGFGWGTAPRL